MYIQYTYRFSLKFSAPCNEVQNGLVDGLLFHLKFRAHYTKVKNWKNSKLIALYSILYYHLGDRCVRDYKEFFGQYSLQKMMNV